MEKVALTLTFPIRIKRISNGEKIIVPGDGRDDVEVRIIRDESKSGESPLVAIHKLLDTGARRRIENMDRADGLRE